VGNQLKTFSYLSATVQYNLACCYVNLGLKESASCSLQNAIQIIKDFKKVKSRKHSQFFKIKLNKITAKSEQIGANSSRKELGENLSEDRYICKFYLQLCAISS
jgi:hypothetical protein